MRLSSPVLPLLAVLLALPSAASALPPAERSGADCVQDNDNGTGGCAQSTDGLGTVTAGEVSPDGRDLYVVGSVDDTVVHLRRDPVEGSLTPVGCIDDNDAPEGPDTCAQSTDGLNSPQDVVVAPDGRSVLVVSANDDAVVNFTRNPATGTLTPAGCLEDNDAPSGPDACTQNMDGLEQPDALAISPDGRDLYVASKSDDAVTQIRRDTVTGALTPGMCADDNDAPDGPDNCALSTNGMDDTQDVTVSPDGTSVYTVSDEDDAIVTFVRSTTNGGLSSPSCIDDNDAGRGPDNCGASTDTVSEAENPVVSPDGKSVYLVAFLLGDQAVARFDRSPSGALTPAGCITNISNGDPACTQTSSSFTGVQGLAIAPDGSALYAASAGPRAVVTIRRGPDGSITPGGCVQDTGNSACARQFNGLNLVRDVAVSPDGRDVYGMGDGDHTVAHLIGERPPVCIGRSSAGLPGALQTVPLDCSDPNGDPLTISAVGAPGGGTVGAVDQVSKTVGYTPNAGFSGLDSFTFRAFADGATSNVATASLLVQAAAGPAGPAGPAGANGANGANGAPGPQGPAGQSAIKLLALLGADVVSAKRGRSVSVRVATTAAGAATLDVLKGSKVVATTKKTLTKAGRAAITWNGKGVAAKGKKAAPLAAGSYTLRLTVVGKDKQKATDAARLKLAKR